MTFEEVKEMFKKSIDTTDTMNQALENLIQSIYLKGYNEALEQKLRWIPVSERLPEVKQHVLLSCYGRVIYGRMISENGNSGYPVFEICDSVGEKRPIVLETTIHSEFTTSRITAWMPLPEPYKASPTGEEVEE